MFSSCPLDTDLSSKFIELMSGICYSGAPYMSTGEHTDVRCRLWGLVAWWHTVRLVWRFPSGVYHFAL